MAPSQKAHASRTTKRKHASPPEPLAISPVLADLFDGNLLCISFP